MVKTLLSLIFFVMLPVVTMGVDNPKTFFTPTDDFQTTEEILDATYNKKTTNCASEIFSNALKDNSGNISEDQPEHVVHAWAKNTMFDAPVLEAVLKCPEIASLDDNEKITFTPIRYEFPLGRNITINYSTTKKVLNQHLLLAKKPSLPNGIPNPKLMDSNDPAKYLNTEPAWYGILVVEHDSLSEFVGADKNNTLSLRYLEDHIDEIYPKGSNCTSKSAITWGNNYDTIDDVVHEVVNMEKDSNDYYVAGDVNLEWVMYAEIAADVILTVVTAGGGAFATGALKGLRATKNAKQLIKSTKVLTKLDDVKAYLKVLGKVSQHSDDIVKVEKNIKNAEKYGKILKKADKARDAGRLADAAKYEKEAKEVLDAARKIDPKMTAESLKNVDKLKDQEKTLTKSLKAAEKEAAEMEKASKNVAQYKKNTEALTDLMKYRRGLRALRRPQTGNIITRAIKAIKGMSGGAKTMNRASRVARAGMSSRSAKIGYWLKDVTLKHGARLAKFESKVGGIYGIVSFLGDMWDKTSATSKEFSNGIDFKPLCLLSADDLEGQENVVNYGMWLMWVGNSTDPTDDDAAYLQAMDFASKFAYTLNDYQEKHGGNCNVDIYVVHPIIRLDETNIDDPHGEMFYLFMNDVPWTSAK